MLRSRIDFDLILSHCSRFVSRRFVNRKYFFEEFKNGYYPVYDFFNARSPVSQPPKAQAVRCLIITLRKITAQSTTIFYIISQYSKITQLVVS